MELFKLLLIVHIIGGFTSLLLGLCIMLLKKGNKKHKTLGKIYFYSMLTASTVAIPMSYLHPNYFLFLISIFTIYMVVTGVRYLNKQRTLKINTMDWLSSWAEIIDTNSSKLDTVL